MATCAGTLYLLSPAVFRSSGSHVVHVAQADLGLSLHAYLIVVIPLPTSRVLIIIIGKTLCSDTVEEEPLLFQTL